MDSSSSKEEVPRDPEVLDVLDLSTFSKRSLEIRKYVKERFSNVREIKKVVTGYKTGLQPPIYKRFVFFEPRLEQLQSYRQSLRKLEKDKFYYIETPVQKQMHAIFSLPLLLALVPLKAESTLTIHDIVLTKCDREELGVDYLSLIETWIPKDINFDIGKGTLIVDQLTIYCTIEHHYGLDNGSCAGCDLECDLKKLRKELSSFGKITINSCKLKILITPTAIKYRRMDGLLSPSMESQDLLRLLPGAHESGIMRQGRNEQKYLVAELEQDLPPVGDDYWNTHTMFGSYECYDMLNGMFEMCKLYSANNILIATLGYGCDVSDLRFRIGPHVKVFEKNFVNDTAPVYDEIYLNPTWLIAKFKSSSIAICQTTYCDGTIANGATSKAVNWLREEWKGKWSKEYDNLVVLIPYGGAYREDEMTAITRATDEGILIVCAAGEQGGEVMFPAALGNVLSVGVADTGPKGREIDICVDFNLCQQNHITPHGSSVAAVCITILLSFFLARIHSMIESSEPAKCIHKYVTLHTCVIRELIINAATQGSHDPQKGYGDGVEIFSQLLEEGNSELLFRIIQVLPKYFCEENRKAYFHGLTGQGIKIAVIDTSFQEGKHGYLCKKAVESVASKVEINEIQIDKERQQDITSALSEVKCGVDIISCSMGRKAFNIKLSQAVSKAIEEEKIVVFAAGNDGRKFRDSIKNPARIGNVLVVGGHDPHNSQESYSSVGRELDFLAPADLDEDYGTSFAAPVVAGYIALLLEFIRRMPKEEYKVKVWKDDKFTDVSVWDAAHNVYAMRDLLQLMVAKPHVHSETFGFGCLDFSVLFPYPCLTNDHDTQLLVRHIKERAKKKIQERLQNFYRKRN